MEGDRRFLILRPAVVIRFRYYFRIDNWRSTFKGSLFFPQPKMLQDFTNDISLIDKADDFHLTAALGAGQRINLPPSLCTHATLVRGSSSTGIPTDRSLSTFRSRCKGHCPLLKHSLRKQARVSRFS